MYWTAPGVGALIAGGYEAIAAFDHWGRGSDHVSRALGGITAYALVGIMLGFIVALLLDSEVPTPGRPALQLRVLEGGKR